MLSELGRRPMIGSKEGSFGDDIDKEISLLLREHRREEVDDLERELNLYRAGSAPPTVEGSLSGNNGSIARVRNGNGINGISSSDDFRSDPAYQAYYYSNVNLNPRLPPPLLTREELRYTQRLKGGSSMVDGWNVNRIDNEGGDPSLFSMPPGFELRKKDVEVEKNTRPSAEWGGNGLIGLPGFGLGTDIFQDDFGRGSPVTRPSSRTAYDENAVIPGSHEDELSRLRELASGSHKASTYAAAVGGSMGSNSSTDPQLIARVPSPCPTPIGSGRAIKSSVSSSIVSALSGLNLSGNGGSDGENPNERDLEQRQMKQYKKSVDFTNSSYRSDRQNDYQKSGNFYTKGSPTSTLNGNGSFPHQYQHLDAQISSFGNMGLNGYSLNPPLPSMMTGNLPNAATASTLGLQGFDSRVLGIGIGCNHNDRVITNQITGNGSTLQRPFVDPRYVQFAALNDPMMDLNLLGNNNFPELQKAYIGQLYAASIGGKYGGSNQNGYYGMSMASPMRQNDPNMCYPSRMRNLAGGFMSSWHLDNGFDEGFGSSLLEEFKNNKAKCFELSEIANHVVEFSSDQYGSRFIQQKLETASASEKTMIYEEIIPHALELMTDVFGNYVIQKFFEYGLPSQRREMGEKLFSNVLTLSLQMYGCRVIQKAIEVVDLDQKIEMVKELDGNVMRCVRDQNGNHVIQKCIECVPEENIKFIISTFFDQIVTLSTHPYGCRVVQRILEHCKEQKTQNKVMDEILSSVSMLAQDQYGNYVVQHVLEHGKPNERSIIIKELAGKIVQISQQKFASNVVEKCLTFGDASERLLLVNEMLGTTDENEPLQAMMKDQFGNYVVQKVLETCDDQMRELILSRIKVHLNALKKYTYGKHIVARVEKLVAAGERRMAVQTLNATAQTLNAAAPHVYS